MGNPFGEDRTALADRMRRMAGKGPSVAGQREPVTSVAKVESDRERTNSRRKGSSFELRVAKAWSRWSGETLRRTPQSGGWGGAQFGTAADLVCPKKRWPFAVEVKAREGWVLDDLITGVRAIGELSVIGWWRQAVQQANTVGKVPLLVFKRNRAQPLVMVWLADWGRMKSCESFVSDFVPTIHVSVDDGELLIVSQDMFHAHVRYDRELRDRLRRK